MSTSFTATTDWVLIQCCCYWCCTTLKNTLTAKYNFPNFGRFHTSPNTIVHTNFPTVWTIALSSSTVFPRCFIYQLRLFYRLGTVYFFSVRIISNWFVHAVLHTISLITWLLLLLVFFLVRCCLALHIENDAVQLIHIESTLKIEFDKRIELQAKSNNFNYLKN